MACRPTGLKPNYRKNGALTWNLRLHKWRSVAHKVVDLGVDDEEQTFFVGISEHQEFVFADSPLEFAVQM